MHQGGFYLGAVRASGAASRRSSPLLGGGWPRSAIVFLVVSVLVLLRRAARRAAPPAPAARDPHRRGRAVGRSAIVLERIANDEGVGCVRIDGEVWTAARYDDDGDRRGRAGRGRRDQGRHGARERLEEATPWPGLIVLVVLDRSSRCSSRRDDPHHPAGAGRRRRAPRPLQPHARAGADDRRRRSSTACARWSTCASRSCRFQPQPVITEDNVVVQIDTVLYFTITERESGDLRDRQPAAGDRAADGHDAAQRDRRPDARGDADQRATTSTPQLRVVLDEATGKWGIRINRVEIKSIDPPPSIQEAMEKQMRAERDRRAAILTAEGVKQSQILTAEGEKQAAILTAEGEREAAILRCRGRGEGDRHGLRGDPRGQPRRAAAQLPVPADAAAARQGRREQGLRDPVGADERARQPRQPAEPRPGLSRPRTARPTSGRSRPRRHPRGRPPRRPEPPR